MKFGIFKRFKKSKDSFWVLWHDKIIFRSKKAGISPILDCLLHRKINLKNKTVFDKVIGRAAALLLVYGGIKDCYGVVGTKEAKKIFGKYHISNHFNSLIPRVLNKTRTSICPFEISSKNRSPKQFFNQFKIK